MALESAFGVSPGIYKPWKLNCDQIAYKLPLLYEVCKKSWKCAIDLLKFSSRFWAYL